MASSPAHFLGCSPNDVEQQSLNLPRAFKKPIAAMIPRGGCSFAEKAMTAQSLGFSALLIENTEDGPPLPPDVSSNALITIPVVMVAQETGNALRSRFADRQRITFEVSFMAILDAGDHTAPRQQSSPSPFQSSSSSSSSSSSATNLNAAQRVRVVTAIPRGLSVTVVQPVVRALTEERPFAEVLIFSEHDPIHAKKSIVKLGARITLARLPSPDELPACSLGGALHAECILALMNLTRTPSASLWVHPSFDSWRVPDMLYAFGSLSAQVAGGDSGDSLAHLPGAPLRYDGVPLASEGTHWQCNGALAFWQSSGGGGGGGGGSSSKKKKEKSKATVDYRFVLPWNLCTVTCEDEATEVRRGRASFAVDSGSASADAAVCSRPEEEVCPSTPPTPIDIVIPAHAKDAVTLQYTVAGARQQVVGARRVIVVSREKLSDDAEFVPEAQFSSLFSMDHVEAVLGSIGVFPNNTRTPFGWYFQQLLKFYAPLVIPGIAENVLVLDSDTVFLRPARFIEPRASSSFSKDPLESGRGALPPPTIFTVTGDESGPQMLHMGRLLSGLRRQHDSMSAIAHHMLLNRGILRDMIAESEAAHAGGSSGEGAAAVVVPFHDLFLLEIDPGAEHKKSASEYEIYFNYFFARHKNQTRVRHVAWCNGLGLEMTQSSSSALYDFVSFHDTFQKKGCAAFCCCQHHEDQAQEAGARQMARREEAAAAAEEGKGR
jgi:hypothetical protein